DPDCPEGAGEDVGAVAGAVHPGAADRARRPQRARAPGDVLADVPAASAAQVAGAADAVDEAPPAERVVREEVPRGHRAGMSARRSRELPVQSQRPESALPEQE